MKRIHKKIPGGKGSWAEKHTQDLLEGADNVLRKDQSFAQEFRDQTLMKKGRLGRPLHHLRKLGGGGLRMNHLFGQDSQSVKDTGGKVHCGRCSPLAGLLQQKGLYTGGKKGALHGKCKMHRKAPEKIKGTEVSTLPRGEVLQNVEPQGMIAGLNCNK